jgi:FAD/FMN-containing dehydrogenase
MVSQVTPTQKSFTEARVFAFQARLHGELIRPGDEAYEAARLVWNRSADCYPGFIVRAADAADVARAVQFARDYDLPIAVRGGSHSVAGFGTIDGGVVIDLSGMKEITIDPVSKSAWAQAGVLSGEYADRAQEFGLATPMGDAGSVGIAGLTLGGGVGYLVRKHGLTIDNLLEVEMVTGDGRIVTASESENADLFWGIRGGGGNFGIVTNYHYRLVDVGIMYGGGIMLPPTKEVIAAYMEFASNAPKELSMIAQVMAAPPAPFVPADRVGEPVFAVLACYAGDLAEGERIVGAGLRALGEPIADVLGAMPYNALYMFTADAATPGRMHIRSTFLDGFSDAGLDTLVAAGQNLPGEHAMIQIRVLGGEMANVDADATAFAHRDAKVMFSLISHWAEASDDAAHHEWIENAWPVFAAESTGVYSNFLRSEGEARTRSAYAESTLERLAEVKQRWDPENIFARNQNIKPAARISAAA